MIHIVVWSIWCSEWKSIIPLLLNHCTLHTFTNIIIQPVEQNVTSRPSSQYMRFLHLPIIVGVYGCEWVFSASCRDTHESLMYCYESLNPEFLINRIDWPAVRSRCLFLFLTCCFSLICCFWLGCQFFPYYMPNRFLWFLTFRWHNGNFRSAKSRTLKTPFICATQSNNFAKFLWVFVWPNWWAATGGFVGNDFDIGFWFCTWPYISEFPSRAFIGRVSIPRIWLC
jgi:hypothetical protein